MNGRNFSPNLSAWRELEAAFADIIEWLSFRGRPTSSRVSPARGIVKGAAMRSNFRTSWKSKARH